jgi:hydrogenase maturation protein HypF
VSFCEAIEHLGRLFEITPEIVVHDLHPDYASTTHALALAAEHDLAVVGVQHHHAHIASCLADVGASGPVIGVAFDGSGFGLDGTVWGGEFLVADLVDAERVGWLAPVPLPGGDAAAHEGWRMAAAYLDALGVADDPPAALATGVRWTDVVAMARLGVQSPLTSSAGRLFDAVAATIGVRRTSTYEGQAAVELEALVDPEDGGAYPMALVGSTLVGADLVAGALADHRAGVPSAAVAARFHHGLAAGITAMCERIGAASGLRTVALSGGVFANVVLLRETTRRLTAAGYEVLRHRRVPCNDGGISLGQAVVAAARIRAGR